MKIEISNDYDGENEINRCTGKLSVIWCGIKEVKNSSFICWALAKKKKKRKMDFHMLFGYLVERTIKTFLLFIHCCREYFS